MKRERRLEHEFVDFIPDDLQDGVIYVSMSFATIAHKCVCGCGNQVITPLSPTDWKLTFDGESISLHPSIGNWNFPCQSHYWIKGSMVHWSGKWSQEMIDAGRARDASAKERYFNMGSSQTVGGANADAVSLQGARGTETLWQTLKRWLFG